MRIFDNEAITEIPANDSSDSRLALTVDNGVARCRGRMPLKDNDSKSQTHICHSEIANFDRKITIEFRFENIAEFLNEVTFLRFETSIKKICSPAHKLNPKTTDVYHTVANCYLHLLELFACVCVLAFAWVRCECISSWHLTQSTHVIAQWKVNHKKKILQFTSTHNHCDHFNRSKLTFILQILATS